MLKATKQNGGEIVGGDTVRSSSITINVSMIGIKSKENNQKKNYVICRKTKAKYMDLGLSTR